MFYSNELFTNLGGIWTPSFVTGTIGIVNFICSIIGIILLGYYGRRTLMLWGYLIMTLSLVSLGVFSILSTNENLTDYAVIGELVSIGFFLLAFETSSGPVTWVYLAEIMQDKGFSIANFLI